MSNEAVAQIQLYSTIVVALANALLAFFTYRYVRLTSGMLEHMQVGRRATITVDLVSSDGWMLSLVVSNTGTAPATDISFEVKDTVTWRSKAGLRDLGIITRGISYLPAGRTLKYQIGAADWAAVQKADAVVTITLKYRTEGKEERREFLIDLAQYIGSSVETSPMEPLVRAIERVADGSRRDFMIARMVHMKKTCVECAEEIPPKARKCSHCGASQPVTEDEKSSSV